MGATDLGGEESSGRGFFMSCLYSAVVVGRQFFRNVSPPINQKSEGEPEAEAIVEVISPPLSPIQKMLKEYKGNGLTFVEALQKVLESLAQEDKLSREDRTALNDFALSVLKEDMDLGQLRQQAQGHLLGYLKIQDLAAVRAAIFESYRVTGSCLVPPEQLKVFEKLAGFLNKALSLHDEGCSMLNTQIPEALNQLKVPVNADKLLSVFGSTFPDVLYLDPFQHFMWLLLGLKPGVVLDKKGNTLLHVIARSNTGAYDGYGAYGAFSDRLRESQIGAIPLYYWAGADKNAKNHQGQTPLEVARFYQRTQTAQALSVFDDAPDTDSADRYPFESLLAAIKADDDLTLQHLIRHGIVDESGLLMNWVAWRDDQGNTLLHLAAFYGNGPSSPYHVLLHSIDPGIINNYGWTALELSYHYRGTYIGQAYHEAFKEAGIKPAVPGIIQGEADLNRRYALMNEISEATGISTEGGREIDFQQSLCLIRRAIMEGKPLYNDHYLLSIPQDEDDLQAKVQAITRFFSAFQETPYLTDIKNYTGGYSGRKGGTLDYYIRLFDTQLKWWERHKIRDEGISHPALQFFKFLLLLGVDPLDIMATGLLSTADAMPSVREGGKSSIGNLLKEILAECESANECSCSVIAD